MYVDNLSGVFFEQRHAKTVCFNSVADFFDVESNRDQEKLRFCFGFSSCQKPSESKILFDYAERTLDLNGSVHPQKDALLCRDPFLRFFVLFL